MKKTNQSKKISDEYGSGKNLAGKWFNHYLNTGTCNPGGSESQIYCEVVASVIRANEPITKEKSDLIRKIKEDKNTSFYDGVCDFLLEKIKEYSQSSLISSA